MYKLELRLYTYIIHICAHSENFMSVWSDSLCKLCVKYVCANVVSMLLLACGYLYK